MRRQGTVRSRMSAVLIAVFVTLLVGTQAVMAEARYKIGDRVEKMSAGAWVEMEVTDIKENDQYVLRDLQFGLSGIWASGSDLRPKGARTAAAAAVDAGHQVQPTATPASAPAHGGTATTPQRTDSVFDLYGAREPRTCADSDAPASGAITAALALKYFNCQSEKIWSGHLYLVEGAKVEVGGGVPYTPNLGAFDAINVHVPLYPIRGSFLQYQCRNLKTAHVGPPDTNCNSYDHANATGYCYKDTFGSWHCAMADRSNNEQDWRKNVAPPKP